MYHVDTEVHEAMTGLANALCAWERNTGRKSTLILVPHQPDEPVVMLDNGREVTSTTPADILIALADAQFNRPDGPPVNRILLEAAADLAQIELELKEIRG